MRIPDAPQLKYQGIFHGITLRGVDQECRSRGSENHFACMRLESLPLWLDC
jgi:hypothetical protein